MYGFVVLEFRGWWFGQFGGVAKFEWRNVGGFVLAGVLHSFQHNELLNLSRFRCFVPLYKGRLLYMVILQRKLVVMETQ